MDRPLEQSQNTIRLPVFAEAARRPGEGNPLGNPQTWEQAYINCYPEFYSNPVTGEKSAAVIKRPGIQEDATLTNTIASYGTSTTMFCRSNIAVTQLDDVYVCAFFDSTASKIYIIQYRPVAGTTTKIGEITSAASTDFVFITEFVQWSGGGNYPTGAGALTPAIAVTWMNATRTTGAGYYAVSSSGVFGAASLTSISSGSFPSNLGTPKVITGPLVQLDGTIYIMTTEGTIYGSGGTGGLLYDITTWNTNTIVVASIFPDKGVACWKYKNILLAFGQDSLEFFVDAAIPPPNSPLERADQAVLRFGTLSPKMIVNNDDTVYWAGYSSSGTMGVWGLNGYTPEKISDTKTDYAFATAFGTTGPGCTNTFEVAVLNYKKHLLINGPLYYTTGYYDTTIFDSNDNVVITPTQDMAASVVCYSFEDKVWWGLSLLGPSSGSVPARHFIYPTNAANKDSKAPWKQFIFIHQGTGNAYLTYLYTAKNLSADGTYYDGKTTGGAVTDPICASIQFNTYWFGTEKRKFIRKAKVICDRLGRAASGDTTNTYKLYICYSREVASVTTGPQFGRAVSLTTTTEPLSRYYINNLGACRSASFLLTMKHTSAWRVHTLELDIDQGTA